MNPVSAGNYAAECEMFLGRAIRECEMLGKGKKLPVEYTVLRGIHNRIKSAVKFAIPDNGRILEDNMKGLRGLEYRLPYPCITVEFFCPSEAVAAGKTHSPKRLCLAVESRMDSLGDVLGEVLSPGLQKEISYQFDCELLILHYVMCSSPSGWHLMPLGWMTPSRWERDNRKTYIRIGREKEHEDIFEITGMPFPVIPTEVLRRNRKFGEQESLQVMVDDIVEEMVSVMELCEALTCSNIVHEPIKEVGNPATRKRFGLPPEYETRVLKIKAPYERGSGSYQSGESEKTDRKMVREHLRRGHIRRYQNGTNIWVNSCVVGAKELGRIEKSYQVKS